MFRTISLVTCLSCLVLFCAAANAADPVESAFVMALTDSKEASAAFEKTVNRQIAESAPLAKKDGRFVFIVDLMPSMSEPEIYWSMDRNMAQDERGLVDDIISGKAGIIPPRFGILLIPEEMFDAGFLASRGLGGSVPWEELNDIRTNDCWPLVLQGARWLGQALAGSAIFAGISTLVEDGMGCEGNDSAVCNWPGGDEESPQDETEGGCSPSNWDACNSEEDSDEDDRNGNEPDGSVVDPGWQNLVDAAANVPIDHETVLVTASGLCISFGP